MTNKEKAKSLWFNFCTEKSCDGHNNCKSCPKAKIQPQLIEMAQWKDEKICEVFNFVRLYLPAHITQEVKKMLNIKH